MLMLDTTQLLCMTHRIKQNIPNKVILTEVCDLRQGQAQRMVFAQRR